MKSALNHLFSALEIDIKRIQRITKKKGGHILDKLQYDSLYKFLVSLGVVLIALPITALIFLENGTMHIISKLEYENLSE